jgi:hypothetical protein
LNRLHTSSFIIHISTYLFFGEKMKELSLDFALFKKVAQRFYKSLDTTQQSHTSLSKTQEQLAQAFGFRNLNGLNSFFEDTSASSTTRDIISLKNQHLFFNKISVSQATLLFKIFVDTKDMWGQRTFLFIDCITPVIYELKKIGIIDSISTDTFLEYSNLDKLRQLYQQNIFSVDTSLLLKRYIINLPQFNPEAEIQKDITYEQHGYIIMQFQLILGELSIVERDDKVIFKPQWVEVELIPYHLSRYAQGSAAGHLFVSSYIPGSQVLQVPEQSSNTKKVILDKHGLNYLYELYGIEQWSKIFSHYDDHNFFSESYKKMPLIINGIHYKESIRNSSKMEDSWLTDSLFIHYWNHLLINRTINTVHMSDFLIMLSDIINQKKSTELFRLIKNLLNNYNHIDNYLTYFDYNQ